VCQRIFPKGTLLYGCRQCNFDMCQACANLPDGDQQCPIQQDSVAWASAEHYRDSLCVEKEVDRKITKMLGPVSSDERRLTTTEVDEEFNKMFDCCEEWRPNTKQLNLSLHSKRGSRKSFASRSLPPLHWVPQGSSDNDGVASNCDASCGTAENRLRHKIEVAMQMANGMA